MNVKNFMENHKRTWFLVPAAGVVLLIAGAMLFNHAVERKATGLAQGMRNVEELKKATLEYLGESHTPGEIEKQLLESFPSLSQQDCTEIVDTYLYGTYNAAAQYELSDEQTNELMQYISTDGVFDASVLQNEELKKQIGDLAEQHIVIRYLNGSLYWDVDYGYFADTFASYLRPDYRDMITFYANEREESYYDEASMSMNTSVVTGRLERAYRLLCTYPDSELQDFMKESYYLYKSIYLGAYAQDYVFDNGNIKREVLDSYSSYVETCSDPELKEFLENLITEYREVNGTRTVPIYELIKTFCGF